MLSVENLLDNVRKVTRAISFIPSLETGDQRQEGQSSSPAPKAKAQTDGKTHSQSSGRRGEALCATRGKIRAAISSGESHQSSGCKHGDKCLRHVEADGQPSKKSKKSFETFSCLVQGVDANGLCVSKILILENPLCGTKEIGIKSHRQILQGHMIQGNFEQVRCCPLCASFTKAQMTAFANSPKQFATNFEKE